MVKEERKERYSGAKALGLCCSSCSWYLVNSRQPMWSHEHDSNFLTKQEKGGRVWEYPEGVVGWMKGDALPLFSATTVQMSLRAAGWQLPSQVPTAPSVGWVP